MKIKLCLVILIGIANGLFAQQENEKNEERKGKFQLNNMYIGGGINLGLGNQSFTVGLIPEVGYSLTKWLDGGVIFNLNYQSQKEIYDQNGFGPYTVRNFNYGAGTFIRIWPLNFLNVTLQPEYNWIRSNQIYEPTGQKGSFTLKSESILVGIGYGSREAGNQLSYFNIMIDLLKNINSPYRDQNNRANPVVRTGFGFYLGRRGK